MNFSFLPSFVEYFSFLLPAFLSLTKRNLDLYLLYTTVELGTNT